MVLSGYRGQLLRIAVKAEKEGNPISEQELTEGITDDWSKLKAMYSGAGVTLEGLIEMGKEVLIEAKNTTEAPELPKAAQVVLKAVEKIGRKQPCPCGSGKKYKKCCGKNE